MSFSKCLQILAVIFSLSVFACSANPVFAYNPEAVQAYNDAIDMSKNGNLQEAVRLFKKATVIDPTFTDAYYNIASIYEYTGNRYQALINFEAVLKRNPGDTEVAYKIAGMYYDSKNYSKALSYLGSIPPGKTRYADAQILTKKINAKIATSSSLAKPIQTGQIAAKQAAVVNNKPVSTKPSEIKQTTIKPTVNVAPNRPVAVAKIIEPKPVAVKQENAPADKPEELPSAPGSVPNNSLDNITINNVGDAKPIEITVTPTEDIGVNKVAENSMVNKPVAPKVAQGVSQIVNNPVNAVKPVISRPAAAVTKPVITKPVSPTKPVSVTELNKNSPIKTVSPAVTTNVESTKFTFKDFQGPTGIVKDSWGNLYIANYTANNVLKISPAGKRTIFVNSPSVNGPIGLVADPFNNIYIANYISNEVIKISPLGKITVILRGINRPYYLYLDKSGMLYISEQGSNSVIRVKVY